MRVANKRYFMLPVYVSFLTWNKAVNQRPILVRGTNMPTNIAIVKPVMKFQRKFNQLNELKLIVIIPESMLVAPIIAAAKHKKKQTGILQIKQ